MYLITYISRYAVRFLCDKNNPSRNKNGRPPAASTRLPSTYFDKHIFGCENNCFANDNKMLYNQAKRNAGRVFTQYKRYGKRSDVYDLPGAASYIYIRSTDIVSLYMMVFFSPVEIN